MDVNSILNIIKNTGYTLICGQWVRCVYLSPEQANLLEDLLEAVVNGNKIIIRKDKKEEVE